MALKGLGLQPILSASLPPVAICTSKPKRICCSAFPFILFPTVLIPRLTLPLNRIFVAKPSIFPLINRYCYLVPTVCKILAKAVTYCRWRSKLCLRISKQKFFYTKEKILYIKFLVMRASK